VEKLSEEELDALVEEATINAYGDDERLGAQRIAACRHWAKFA
jgi:hypothetical protein